MKRPRTIFFMFLLMLIAGAAYAAQGGKTPTEITSERVEYVHEGSRVVFEGKVHVSRPDFQIWADTITVHFTPGAADAAARGNDASTESIEKIEAAGNVTIKRGSRVGRCARAVYLVKQGLIRLEGNPTIEDGENVVQGEIIKFYLKDNRSEIIGGDDQRVRAIFYFDQDANLP